jgi:hypothetical protein
MISEATAIKNYPNIVSIVKNSGREITTTLPEFINLCKNLDNMKNVTITYKDKCGHESPCTVNTLKKNKNKENDGKCSLCQYYEKLEQEIKDEGCMISMDINTFILRCKQQKHIKNIIIDYFAQCEHLYQNTLSSFRMGCGKKCINCSNENNHTTNEDGSSKTSSLEDRALDYLEQVKEIKENLKMVRTDDGCLADLAIKLTENTKDKWIQIQVKSTASYSKGGYHFVISKKYIDCVVLCISLIENDIRFWIFNGNDLTDKKEITMGKYNSQYKQNEIKENEICDKLIEYINSLKQFEFDIVNLPVSANQQKEQRFRKIRERYCDFFIFQYPERTGLKNDFILNYKKVQEKVSQYNHKYNTYGIQVHMGKKPYEKGQNDFYWFHFPDEKGFIVLPEQILINNGHIKTETQEGKRNFYLNIHNQIYEEYIFDYNNLEHVQNKLTQMFV